MTIEEAKQAIAAANAEFEKAFDAAKRMNRLHNEGREGYEATVSRDAIQAAIQAAKNAGYYYTMGELITKDQHIANRAAINNEVKTTAKHAGDVAKIARKYGYLNIDDAKCATKFFGL
jgi:predicted ABC-type ATPase